MPGSRPASAACMDRACNRYTLVAPAAAGDDLHGAPNPTRAETRPANYFAAGTGGGASHRG